MRCLTLADQIQKSLTVNVVFLCRTQEGDMNEFIRKRGFQCLELPRIDLDIHADMDDRDQNNWYRIPWEQDARDVIALVGTNKMDLLIIDHYSLDSKWQQKLRSLCCKIMVIDDLANRQHECDLLLDQTYQRQVEDYYDLVPASCLKLLGTDYALLRPDFSLLRSEAIKKRNKTKMIKNILVFVGGSDTTNLTELILNVLQQVGWSTKPLVNVVLGPQSQNMESVKDLLSNYLLPSKLMSNVQNMAELMKDADLSIGAAGATAWERCTLGLPTLMNVLSDNQKTIAEELKKIGAVNLWRDELDLKDELEAFTTSVGGVWFNMQKQAQEVCDGNGAKRVVEAIERTINS